MDNLGFGLAFVLRDEFSATAQRVQRGFASLERGAQSVATRVSSHFGAMSTETNTFFGRIESGATNMTTRVVDAMGGVYQGLGLVGMGLGTLAPLSSAIGIAGQFEKAQFQLETLLKSSEKAKEVFSWVLQDEPKTPFGVAEITRGNTALIAAGESAENARKNIMGLANAIAASGGGNAEFNRMITNLQQIKNLGKASAVDIKQFGYAGIPIYKLLSEATGKNVEEIKKSKISYEVLTNALNKAAAAGGFYENAMEKMSQTISGKTTTLHTRFQMFAAAFGSALAPAYHKILDLGIKLLENLTHFLQSPVGQIVAQFIGVTVAVAGVSIALLGVFKLVGAIGVAFRALPIFEVRRIFNIFAIDFIGGLGRIALRLAFVRRLYASFLLVSHLSAFTNYLSIAASQGSLLAKSMIFLTANARALNFAVKVLNFTLAASALFFLVAAIYAVTTGYGKFKAMIENNAPIENGLSGFAQRVGGVMYGVVEAVQNMNDKTFSLSEQTAAKLEELGILGAVTSIMGTIARFKAMFEGMWTEFSSGFDTIKGIFSSTFDIVSDIVGVDLGGMLSNMDTWKTVGESIGFVFKWVAIIISGIISVAITLGAVIWKSISWVVSKIWGLISWIWEKISWVAEKFNSLTFGFNGGSDGAVSIGENPMQQSGGGWLQESVNNRMGIEWGKAAQIGRSSSPQIISQKPQITNITQLDGREIYRSVQDYSDENAARMGLIY